MMGSKAGTKIAEGTLAKVWGILYETKTVCRTDFQVPSVASKNVSPSQSVGQTLWELAGFLQLSSR